MNNLIWIIAPLMFVMGCGDKDEDTGQDTEDTAVDTAGVE